MKTLKILLVLAIGLMIQSCSKEKKLERQVEKKGCLGGGVVGYVVDECTLTIPNIISVNGDGVNEMFSITVHNLSEDDTIIERLIITHNGGALMDNNTRVWQPIRSIVDEGFYTYRYRGSINGETFDLQGDFTLVKYQRAIKKCEQCITVYGNSIANDPGLSCK